MDPLRSDRLTAALDRAIASGDARELHDLLERFSGLPGPRPNLELARALGQAIARHEGRADALLSDLAQAENEYHRIVAAAAFAARSLAMGPDKRRAASRAASALASLQELAEDPRHVVRTGIIDALRVRIGALGEPAVLELAAWTDGYLQAHVALEALADRTLLTTLPSAEPVLARLDEAFVLADASPRAAERTQGMRLLRDAMAAQIAIFAARYPETLRWLEVKAPSKRPETRAVVAGAITALRRSVISDVEALRLTALMGETGKQHRDANRVVAGTRRRGRGRT